jgi:hypothetical protein
MGRFSYVADRVPETVFRNGFVAKALHERFLRIDTTATGFSQWDW